MARSSEMSVFVAVKIHQGLRPFRDLFGERRGCRSREVQFFPNLQLYRPGDQGLGRKSWLVRGDVGAGLIKRERLDQIRMTLENRIRPEMFRVYRRNC